MATSEQGNGMYPISWREFKDPVTGSTEIRKVAKPFAQKLQAAHAGQPAAGGAPGAPGGYPSQAPPQSGGGSYVAKQAQLTKYALTSPVKASTSLTKEERVARRKVDSRLTHRAR
ncbi:MAG: hypothetical protein Q9157_008967 [Trypethelium eluteriae]